MSRGMSTHSKIGVVLGSVGVIAAGLFAIFAPIEEMRAEVPYYFEIGVVAIVWGILMFFGLFMVRIKSFLVFVLYALFAAALGFAAYYAGPYRWEFYIYGGISIILAIYALVCLAAVFTGDDPVANP